VNAKHDAAFCLRRRQPSAAAPIGTIKNIRVKPGDSVAVDAVIMEFA
jgi:hypothetical protein